VEATSGMMAATHPTDAARRGNGRHVATRMSFEQTFAADPATVMALLSDAGYVQDKGERTGSFDVSVDITPTDDGGVVITSTRSMPAEVPSYAAPFVGDTITITEVQTWTPLDGGGTATAAVTVEFNSPLAYRGTIALSPSEAGTVALNEGEFKASVPFVGGKVERVASDMTQKYLAKEAKVAADHLSR
jgi:hypothetical protein